MGGNDMELTPEIIGSGIAGLLIAGVMFGNYLRSLKQPPKQDPLLSGIAGGLVEHDQMNDLIHQVKRIADILENKSAAELKESIHDIKEQLEQIAPRKR